MLYLQITKATIALYLAGAVTHWSMTPIKTNYLYPNGDTVLVVDARWIDSVGMSKSPVKAIDFDLKDGGLNVVVLDKSELAK